MDIDPIARTHQPPVVTGSSGVARRTSGPPRIHTNTERGKQDSKRRESRIDKNRKEEEWSICTEAPPPPSLPLFVLPTSPPPSLSDRRTRREREPLIYPGSLKAMLHSTLCDYIMDDWPLVAPLPPFPPFLPAMLLCCVLHTQPPPGASLRKKRKHTHIHSPLPPSSSFQLAVAVFITGWKVYTNMMLGLLHSWPLLTPQVAPSLERGYAPR